MGNTLIQGIYNIYSLKQRKSRQLKYTAKKSLAALGTALGKVEPPQNLLNTHLVPLGAFLSLAVEI